MLQEMRIRNYSERTIETYASLLNVFLHHCKKPLEEISTEDVKDYIYFRLKRDEFSVSTINQMISSWKIVYVHLLGKNWEGCRIVRPRRNKTLPEVLSQSEALSLIDAPTNLKHRAILNLMYSTGIRRNELLALRLTDIDWLVHCSS